MKQKSGSEPDIQSELSYQSSEVASASESEQMSALGTNIIMTMTFCQLAHLQFISRVNWAAFGFSAAGNTTDDQSSGLSSSTNRDSDSSKCRHSYSFMTMPRTLALCYLALIWVREAITLADLLRFGWQTLLISTLIAFCDPFTSMYHLVK